MTEELEVDLEARGAELWVVPRGDLDVASAPELAEALGLAVASDATAIVVDLRGVGLLDSTGLRALLEPRAHEGGERIVFVEGSEHVMGVLRVAGLLDALPFRPAGV